MPFEFPRRGRAWGGVERGRARSVGQLRKHQRGWLCGHGVLFGYAVLGFLIAASPAVAGSISLGMTPEPEVRQGALVVSLGIRNGGDEAARSVSPALQFLGKTTRAEVRPLLRPNETWRVDLTAPAVDLVTGRWPYRIMVDYADANEYPFHALHVGTVVAGAPPPAKFAVVGIIAPPLAT